MTKKISDKLTQYIKEKVSSTPQLFKLNNPKDASELGKLFTDRKVIHVVDDFSEQQLELFAVNNPAKVYSPTFKNEFQEYYKQYMDFEKSMRSGVWVFYPWISTLVHVLNEQDYLKVRTARNRYLINPEEQGKFYNAKIGIGGLSVGNSVALAIVLQGGAKNIKLADHDKLALSNINRIRAGAQDLGLSKVEMTARQIYLINPYAKIEIYSEGLTPKNISKFFQGLDLVVDELDNIAVKYLIREQAKKNRIPVVMGADNGDNAVIDVERYDLDKNLPFFHGRIGNVNYDQLTKLDKFGIGRTITMHIGAENITERMQQSLLEMGKSIVSWPQLGGAALLNGSAVAYVIRRILNGQEIEQNRAVISLDEKLIPSYNSAKEKAKRQKLTNNFKKMMGLK
jgi:hypothetical protein